MTRSPGRPRAPLEMEAARALREAGLSLREIARTYGVGVATVHRLLKSVPKPVPKFKTAPPGGRP